MKRLILLASFAALAACDQLPFDMPGGAPAATGTTDQAAMVTPEATATPQDTAVEDITPALDPNRVCKAYEDGFQDIAKKTIRDIEGCWLKGTERDIDGYLKFENGTLHSIEHGSYITGDFPYTYQNRCRDDAPYEEGRIVRAGYICQNLISASNRSVTIQVTGYFDTPPPHLLNYTLISREDAGRLDAQVAERMNRSPQ